MVVIFNVFTGSSIAHKQLKCFFVDLTVVDQKSKWSKSVSDTAYTPVVISFQFNITWQFYWKTFFFCSMSFLENKIARLNHVIKVSVFKSFKQFLKSPVWYIYKRVNGLLSKWFIYFYFFFESKEFFAPWKLLLFRCCIIIYVHRVWMIIDFYFQ